MDHVARVQIAEALQDVAEVAAGEVHLQWRAVEVAHDRAQLEVLENDVQVQRPWIVDDVLQRYDVGVLHALQNVDLPPDVIQRVAEASTPLGQDGLVAYLHGIELVVLRVQAQLHFSKGTLADGLDNEVLVDALVPVLIHLDHCFRSLHHPGIVPIFTLSDGRD